MKLCTTHSQNNPLLKALGKCAVEVEYLGWDEVCQRKEWFGVNAFYGNLFDEIKTPLDLLGLKRRLARAGVPYVFWNRDAPWNTGMKLKSRLAMQWIKPVDIYLTHSMQNFEWFGGEAHYFPNAAQPEYYETTDVASLNNESTYCYDVSFFGSCGGQRDRNARNRHAFLVAVRHQLQRKAPSVRFLEIDTSKQALSLSDQLALIRSTKINLNFGAMCDLPGNSSWGVPERVFGIPAAGGLVISDTRKHLEITFSAGVVPVFDGPEACVQQILELLRNFDQMRALAKTQYQHVLERHTYRQRAEQLLQILQNYQQASRDKYHAPTAS